MPTERLSSWRNRLCTKKDFQFSLQNPMSTCCFETAAFLLEQRVRVLTSRDARTGFNIARNSALDLLIVNCRLNDASGVDLAERIQEAKSLPVIFYAPSQIPDLVRRRHSFGHAFHLKRLDHASTLCEVIRLSTPAAKYLVLDKGHSEPNRPHGDLDSEIRGERTETSQGSHSTASGIAKASTKILFPTGVSMAASGTIPVTTATV